MKEYKFKAWNKVTKLMSLPFSLEGIVIHTESITSYRGIDDELEFLQYIGLQDKNGIGVYYGDLVVDDWKNIWSVDWSDCYAGYELTLQKAVVAKEFPQLNICRVIDMVVVGNISGL